MDMTMEAVDASAAEVADTVAEIEQTHTLLRAAGFKACAPGSDYLCANAKAMVEEGGTPKVSCAKARGLLCLESARACTKTPRLIPIRPPR